LNLITPARYPFLSGGGEAAEIIAGFDWAATPLGPIESWPASLKSTIALILRSPVPIVTLWGEDGIMIYNDGYSGFAGGRHPNLFGSKVREGWPEVADFNDNIMKVGLAGETLAYRDFPLTLYRHGGKPEHVWLNLDYSPLLGEDGRPAGVMAIVIEITDKVRIERELEAERKSLRLMFEQAPGFIAMLSGPEHRFTMVNEAYRTLVAGRDVVGRTVAVALPEVVGQGFVGLLDQVYVSGEPHIGRGAPVNLQHGPDGVLAERYLDFIYQPIVADGATTGIFIQGHDVTEQHETEKAIRAEVAERLRAEEALRVLNNTLEQRVHDEVSARSKVEEQLRQVQKMEAVGQLTGGIAHDFNNMLAVIMGGLNLLQRKLARGETDVERFVEGAIDGAQRAATLTQRLLAFSRQQPLSPEPLIINKLVAGMSELLDRTLGEQIKVETVLAAGLWQVMADPAQLENAILNLAVNARDAMPDGGRLTIETMNAFVDDAYAQEYAIEAGQYVLIAVADTGAGMAPEVIAKAFDPFFTTKGAGKGTGLGLSQVYGFVRQSGGHVKIYSELGVGTSVKIYLPRLYGEAAATEQAKRLATIHRGLRSEIILVVEDEERVRALSVEALKELGYGVVEASGPSHALRMLDEGQQVTLLFTDVVMPDMSGRQLADHALGKRPNLKVLYTTGYTRNAIVHNGMLDPGTNLLTKPFSIEELAAKVRKILDEEA
jgi:signal transduction histidine kinase/ActR/RegA family two-component response regulator